MQSHEGDLADVGRLTGHVGAGEDLQSDACGLDVGVVGDELFFDESLLKNGVAAVDDLQDAGFVEDGAGVLVELRGLGESR